VVAIVLLIASVSLLLVGSKAEEFPDGRAEVTRDALFISSKAGFLNSGERV
jgi:hypothetical protein